MTALATLCLVGASTTFGVSGDPWGFYYGEVVRQWLSPLGWEVRIGATPGIRWDEWRPDAPIRERSSIRGEITPGEPLDGPIALPQFTRPVHPFTYYHDWSQCDVAWVMMGLSSAIRGIYDPAGPVPAAEWGQSVRVVSQAILEAGAKRVIIPMDYRMAEQFPIHEAWNHNMEGYEAEWLAYMADPHAGIVPGPNLFRLIDPALHFASDPIHPNWRGHRFLADRLLESLAPVAAELELPWW